MPTIQVQAELTKQELLQAVKQLDTGELEDFVAQVLVLQAQHRAPHLVKDEAELLLQVNQTLPLEDQRRYDELVGKRQAETLTPGEHDELLRLTETIEELEVQRVANLVELARLRQVTLADPMKQLGIQPPNESCEHSLPTVEQGE